MVAAENGSMRRELFPEWCRHFVDQLPPHQGCHGVKEEDLAEGMGKWFVLFLDGHTSR